MLKNKCIYWNPVLETLSHEKLQALQLKKFRRIVEWAYNNSPFYHRHYKKAGLEPGDIKRFEDIRKVPVTAHNPPERSHPETPYATPSVAQPTRCSTADTT